MRFSIQRYILSVSGVDITNTAFQTSNFCFDNVRKVVKRSGKCATKHHAEIEPEDLHKLYDSFDLGSPFGLQISMMQIRKYGIIEHP